MIQGLTIFRDFFAGFEDRYTLIGGVACYLNMAEAELDFRATKDLDIVLSTEALDAEFAEKFWDFVKAGGYEHQEKSTGEKQFYRFSKPADATYPYMLELFSCRPEAVFLDGAATLTPIPVDDDVVSLSAILLDEAYYRCIQNGKIILDGVPILSVEYIIPFKMRAFCDLSERKERGLLVDTKNINKHKNDVLKIAQLLSPEQTVEVSEEIKQHMKEFMMAIQDQPIDLKNLGLSGITLLDILSVFKRIYALDWER
ncbi:hypothetical protein RGU70_13350 [Herbaspirillum sp. RTI4]|uniref:hypothetical protein n=1 Tax=Herbaspirillum sp. RTI4 TaxID=3048640 RepID=UPI002AB46FD2|nr:hypothetical protein [Herbaspirillum sp. RTI4]MDY7579302.1 hypothetical protein [Herbaspirillum sp. RTI4]MEA9980215.1 hypothetical protein [Herbaspirillum sp. RTI4]